jgi:hypothetical protein
MSTPQSLISFSAAVVAAAVLWPELLPMMPSPNARAWVSRRAAANELKKHFRELNAKRLNKLGGKRSNFYSCVAEAVQNPQAVAGFPRTHREWSVADDGQALHHVRHHQSELLGRRDASDAARYAVELRIQCGKISACRLGKHHLLAQVVFD